MVNNNRGGSIIANLGWSFSSKILAQGVAFIVSLFLARLLSPGEYGEIALVQVFINIANVFVISGFGEALVQRKNVTIKDYSTIFWCTLTLSVSLYVIIFFTSPLIAGFYQKDSLISIVRVLGILIPISSLNTVQNAYISRNMLFNISFWSLLSGTLISGAAGITMAYLGFGVWSLVAQQIVNILVNSCVLLITLKWRPSFNFDKAVAKDMIGFSWKITGAALLNEVYAQFRSLVVGKKYSTEDLAFYNKGDQFPNLFIANVNNAVSSVFFPIMSRLQDDKEELKNTARKVLQLSSYIIFPIMIGLIAVSENLIYVLLGEKWLPCVPYLRILSIFWMVQPIQTVNWQVIKSLGRSDLCLKLEILKKVVGFTLILIMINFGVLAIAWSSVVIAIFSALVNMIPNIFLIKYKLFEQFKDIAPSLLFATIMGVCAYLFSFVNIQIPFVLLCLQILIGVAVYLMISIVFKPKAYCLFMQYIKNFFKKSKESNKNA